MPKIVIKSVKEGQAFLFDEQNTGNTEAAFLALQEGWVFMIKADNGKRLAISDTVYNDEEGARTTAKNSFPGFPIED